MTAHPRPRIGKTDREWKRDPNKEQHRQARLRARSEAAKEAKKGK